MKTLHNRVTVDVNDGVAQVALARPEKMNALDRPMFEAIGAAIDELATQDDLRAVVLSGNGRCFCAGIDTQAITTAVGKPTDIAARTHGLANLFQHVAWGWHTLPVPVIAAVHGVAFGGGFQIALGADLRIVTPDVRMSVMEIKYGLIPDMAGIARLASLCGDDRRRELTFTGRELTGIQAVAYGLATDVHADPLAEATRLAHEIANKDPQAIRAAKRLLNLAQDGFATTILQAEADEQLPLLERLIAKRAAR